MFSIAFLSVMAMFAIGNMFLKLRRSSLRADETCVQSVFSRKMYWLIVISRHLVTYAVTSIKFMSRLQILNVSFVFLRCIHCCRFRSASWTTTVVGFLAVVTALVATLVRVPLSLSITMSIPRFNSIF